MKTIRRAFFLFAVFWVAFTLWPYPHDVKYHEADYYKYYTLTFFEIRKAPRISDDYYFAYVEPDDGGWIESSIVFVGGDASQLRVYLKGLGFYLYRIQGNGLEEVWLPVKSQRVEYSILRHRKANAITLAKFMY